MTHRRWTLLSLMERFKRSRDQRVLDEELNEEMADHLARKQAELEARDGLSRDEATRLAFHKFGNPTLVREEVREIWGWPRLEACWTDLKLALRRLQGEPLFSLSAVLCIALGIGLNLTVFSILDRLLLRPLPVPDSGELIALQHRAEVGGIHESMSYPDFLDYRDGLTSIRALAAYTEFSTVLTAQDSTAEVLAELVTEDYFTALGIQPLRGRWFAPNEMGDKTGGGVVVIGEGIWSKKMGRDPTVIGKTVRVGGHEFTVVGIVPRSFSGINLDRGTVSVWLPFASYRLIDPDLADRPALESNRGNHSVRVFGRLEPETTIEAAGAEVTSLSDSFRESVWQRQKHAWVDWRQSAPTWKGLVIRLDRARLNPDTRATLQTFLFSLAAISSLFFGFALCNLGLIFSARVARLRKEIAIRMALGVSAGRLFQQSISESLMLALLGLLAGLLISAGFTSWLGAMYPPFRAVTEYGSIIEARSLVVGLCAGSAVALLLGALPLVFSARRDLIVDLRSMHRLSATRGLVELRRVLVAGQVALCTVLIAGAILFLGTLRNAVRADITHEAGSVLMAHVRMAKPLPPSEDGLSLYANLIRDLEDRPSIKSAALVFVVPLGGRRGGTNVDLPAEGDLASRRTLQVDFNVATPKYFETVGIPVISGRPFDARDNEKAPRVAVVNHEWTNSFYGGRDPIGKHFLRNGERYEIVGLVRDGSFRSVRHEVKPCFYVPLSQFYLPAMHLEIRHRASMQSALADLRGVGLQYAPRLVIGTVRTLEEHRNAGLERERLAAALLSLLGGLTLILAAVGVFSVLAAYVVERTPEVGIRVALGATRRQIVESIVLREMRWVMGGVAAGAAFVFAASRLVESLLFGISASSAEPYLLTITVLVVTAALSMVGPLVKAAAIDPAVALRAE